MKIDAKILNCEFRDNIAKEPKGASDNKFGGSAIYLSLYTGLVDQCNFINNKGYGGICKVVNHFHEQKSSSLTNLLSLDSSLITHCSFETNKKDDCAIFYVRGENAPKFELRIRSEHAISYN